MNITFLKYIEKFGRWKVDIDGSNPDAFIKVDTTNHTLSFKFQSSNYSNGINGIRLPVILKYLSRVLECKPTKDRTDDYNKALSCLKDALFYLKRHYSLSNRRKK